MQALKRHMLVTLVAVAVGLGGFVAASRSAFLAPILLQGETSSFRYSGQVERNGNLHATVSVDFDRPAALQAYIAANQQRGRALALAGQGPVPVRITFARPLSQAEVQALARETGLTVDSFMMVGRTAIGDKRATHVSFRSIDEDVPLVRPDLTGNGDDFVLKGVMVVYATLKDARNLTRLLDDAHIYLVDSSEVELREVFATRHAIAVAGRDMTMSAPSPYWKLNW